MRRFRVSGRLLAAAGLLCIASTSASGAIPDRGIEDITETSNVREGIDVVYVDQDAAPRAPRAEGLLHRAAIMDEFDAPAGVAEPTTHLYSELGRGLVRYHRIWGSLPQLTIPAGPALRQGQQGDRVAMLRERLGLAAGSLFDAELAGRVRDYQRVHGLAASAIADAATLASLNLGAGHYEQLILVNMERMRALPSEERSRYILVDAADARLWLYEHGQPVDSMKVIVGSSAHATPMIAASIRYAQVNPYWNVPQDLVQRLIVPNVLKQGTVYLRDRRYEILSDWTPQATPVDPATIDWKAAADSKQVLRVRQMPGPANSMGQIKFMMPNQYGIYLHDTPNKALFAQEDRWLSNGCIRVEDAQRLAQWLFGSMPRASAPERDEDVQLPAPVPVYVTYLTAVPGPDGVVFRADHYGRDGVALAGLFGTANEIESASRAVADALSSAQERFAGQERSRLAAMK